jgi:hypothetical protein
MARIVPVYVRLATEGSNYSILTQTKKPNEEQLLNILSRSSTACSCPMCNLKNENVQC